MYVKLKPNLVLLLLNFNFKYQKVLKIQACMFNNKIQVLFFYKNIPSNKFGMLKTYLFNP